MATAKKWTSVMILGEEYWQIDVPLQQHSTKEEAEALAQSDLHPIFRLHEGRAAIVIEINGKTVTFFDEHVTITEVSKEKQAAMGPPLDMSVEGGRKAAVEALESHDKSYIVEPEDMVASDKTLSSFLNRYGEGYKPDHIAYGVI